MVEQVRGRTRDVDADHVAVRGQPLEERDRIVPERPERGELGQVRTRRPHLRPHEDIIGDRARPQPVGSSERRLPDGYAIRPASLEDLDGVAEMLLADDLADTGQSDFDADFLRDQWSSPGLDLSGTRGS